MTWALALSVALLAALPRPPSEFAPRAAFEEAQAKLEAWDLPAARRIADALVAHLGHGALTDELLGRVLFYEGDYAGALKLLSGGAGPLAKLAQASVNEFVGYEERESAHFSLRFPKGADELLVPYALDALEKAYTAIGADLDFYPRERVRVEILRDPAALARLSPLTEKEIHDSGTIALCKFDKLMVTSPEALVTGYAWQDTLAHEFTHYLITRRSDNTVPIWLHEGIAKFEESRWRGAAGQALSPAAAALLARRLRENRLIPFAKMHPSMALLPTQEDATLAFAEVATAVEYLYRKHGGSKALVGLLDRLRAGKDETAAVEAVAGESFAAFQASWRAYLRARPMPREVLPLDGDRLRFKDARGRKATRPASAEPDYGELDQIEDPIARREAHLGELLRARHRTAASIVEYAKAEARVGARAPALSNEYALALLELRHPDPAEALLRASLKPFPGIAETHLRLGQLLLEERRWAEARDELLWANSIDPFDPEIHLGLEGAFRGLGDEAAYKVEARALKLLRSG